MQTPHEIIPDPLLLDLVTKMMQVEPQKRLSANELLKHSFFLQKN
jgi:serine/threonine protein kinase